MQGEAVERGEAAPPLQERLNWAARIRLEKFASEEDYVKGVVQEVVERESNLLLNEGIAELEDLLIGAGGGEVAYSNANARIGVGDSNTAAAPAQAGLLGANTAFKAMDATFPSRAAQTVTWRATFGAAEGNFAWEEWTVDNGAVRNRNLNRKVEPLGTKVMGAVWQLSVQITIS